MQHRPTDRAALLPTEREFVESTRSSLARAIRATDNFWTLSDEMNAARATYGARSAEFALARNAYREWKRDNWPQDSRTTYEQARTLARMLGLDIPAEIRGTRQEWTWVYVQSGKALRLAPVQEVGR